MSEDKDAAKLAEIVAVAVATVIPVAVDIVQGLLHGDAPAYRRVSHIIPEEYKAKAKLLSEEARLEALKEADNG